MRKTAFQPCIPTRGRTVPAGPEWLHEIKHDGYRLIVERDRKRVRLWTRGGHDWSDRFPLITEAALRNRNSSFVIDGEAALLGVDGRSDFGGLQSRQSSTPSTVSLATARISAGCRRACARPISPGCWR